MFVRGGRQRLTPRGHGELHALAAHGDRGLQRGRIAGGHGGCGVWEIALRSARVRGVPVGVSNRREPAIFNNSGPNRPRGKGRGWRTYSRLRPWRATGCWRRHAEPSGVRGSRRGGFPSGESRGASRGSECAPNRAVCVEVRSRSFWIPISDWHARCSPGPHCEPQNPKAGVHTHSRRDVRACGRVTPPRGARFAPHFEFRAR
jgi:hypothetical protein